MDEYRVIRNHMIPADGRDHEVPILPYENLLHVLFYRSRAALGVVLYAEEWPDDALTSQVRKREAHPRIFRVFKTGEKVEVGYNHVASANSPGATAYHLYERSQSV